jgi:hypothetical protein
MGRVALSHMIQEIIQHACRPGQPGEPFITMTYGERMIRQTPRWSFIPPVDFDWATLPTSAGIYFILSHNRTRLQKIGVANQKRGFQNRIRAGYWQCTHNPEAQGGDLSAAFWYRVMTDKPNLNELSIEAGGQPVDFYFKSFSRQIKGPDIFGVGEELLNYDPHSHLEQLLIKRAINLRQGQGNPELFATNESYALLLDSANRITSNQINLHP